MIGRAALGDPWIFEGRDVSAREAAHFLLEYASALDEVRGFTDRGVAGRVKQLVRHWIAGGLVAEDVGAADVDQHADGTEGVPQGAGEQGCAL